MTEDNKEQAAALRAVLKEAYGISAGPRTGVDKLKMLIANAEDGKYQQQMLKANKQQNLDPVKEAKRQEVITARQHADRLKTEEEILDIVKPYTDRGMQVKFNGDDTWTFNGRTKLDSGHMTASPEALKTVAMKVMTPTRVAKASADLDGALDAQSF